jgi:hypothetical protein
MDDLKDGEQQSSPVHKKHKMQSIHSMDGKSMDESSKSAGINSKEQPRNPHK